MNPKSRFCSLEVLGEESQLDAADPSPRTQFIPDASRTIIATNDSPDIPFEASINAYRGCEHGCVYCFARPAHEYLDMSAGLDFETRILVKHEAPALLRKELSSPKWLPKVIAMSGVTDCYQPVERKLRITRGCLEVLAEFRNPVSIVTKNFLVTRDIDLLADLAKHDAACVHVSLTTLDGDLARVMEPRTSHPRRRLEAMRMLTDAGVPVTVLIAPVVPGLTDHELPALVAAAAGAGAVSAYYIPLRLPYGVKDLFADWLGRHFPDRKEKVLGRVREIRAGKLNDANFGSRLRGEGVFAGQFKAMFEMACRKAGLHEQAATPLSTAAFRRPWGAGEQGSLF